MKRVPTPPDLNPTIERFPRMMKYRGPIEEKFGPGDWFAATLACLGAFVAAVFVWFWKEWL